ncbi:Eco57I restriction-modification methylase domain-containing protein [Rhizobium leguminosarum]|uniref:Eco57I restriction-modification methylase domain-containing protein n=1 Tax=Rhizobium leguminosarum TaxID=384 RepID=UPI0013DBE57E|nr:N-6 DNA methylase [Rhizobium leguminosarum]
MPLFHPRVLKKHLQQAIQPTTAQRAILQSWAANLAKGLYDSETKNDGQFIEHILVQLLGYRQSGTSPEAWTLVKNQPIGPGNADVALGHFDPSKDAIVAPFELKGAKTHDLDAIMPGRNKTPVQQVWEYAMDAKGAKWALVSNFSEIRLYAVGYGRKDYELFDLTKPDDVQAIIKLVLLLSAENLLSGNTLSLLVESALVEKEITDALYLDYRELRTKLISYISASSASLPMLDVVTFAQTILDRVLFIAFAEDRSLLPRETLKKTFEASNPFAPQPVWTNFKGLFAAIDKGRTDLKIPAYNGGLFAPNPQLDAIELSDSLCEGFKAIGGYDFDSEVSVNILGHIFEQSISDIEEIKLAAVGAPAPTKIKRKRDGIFYTPPQVTRYIVEKAVGGWLSERKGEIGFSLLPELTDADYKSITVVQSGKNAGQVRYNKNVEAHIKAWEAYDKALRDIRIIDPACGSGAFLNEAFDFLYREGQTINSQLTTLHGGQLRLFRWDTHILNENLYGVDINSESVEITKLSLWLKTANRAEKLTYLDNSIQSGNSLIDDSNLVGEAAFHWEARFDSIMKAGGFDVVIGNPPYVLSRDNTLDKIKEYVRQKYVMHDDKINLYILFIEKSISILKKNGFLSFIIPNSFLGIDSAKKTREYLVYNTTIQSVVNILGPTFKEASVEAMVFCAKKEQPSNHLVEAGTVASARDVELPLSKIPQQEWLKTPNVIFDLKSDEADRKLLEKLSLAPKLCESFHAKAGLQAYEKGKGTPPQTSEDVKSHPFDADHKLDATTYRYLNGGDVGRYELNWSKQWLRWGPWLSQPRDMSLFSGERVLVREITGRYPKSIMSTYVNETYLNNKSIINIIKKDSNSDMVYLCGLLNSKLMSFFHSRRAVKANRNIFPKAVVADIRNYPVIVPDVDVREKINDQVKSIIANIASMNKLDQSFLALLTADFGGIRHSEKLISWYNLTPQELIGELEKQKKKLTLAKKAEWLDYHLEQVKARRLIEENVQSAEADIDDKINDIYGLSTDEVALLGTVALPDAPLSDPTL